MNAYFIILTSSLITLVLILISPPEKFYNINVKWYKKFTWRAWITISLSLVTTALTIYKQQEDDTETRDRKNQMNRIEKKNLSILNQLDKIGLRFDSNSNNLIAKIDLSKKVYPNRGERVTSSLSTRPFLDLCIRGIQVLPINDTSLYFNIPYCAIDQNSGFNVQLQSVLLYKLNNNYNILSDGKEEFPRGVVINDKVGKAIEYRLSSTKGIDVRYLYIFVKGSYTDMSGTTKYKIQDIFKKSAFDDRWVRFADVEDRSVRDYLKSKNLY